MTKNMALKIKMTMKIKMKNDVTLKIKMTMQRSLKERKGTALDAEPRLH